MFRHEDKSILYSVNGWDIITMYCYKEMCVRLRLVNESGVW